MVTEALTDEDKQKWKQSLPSNPPVVIHVIAPTLSRSKLWSVNNREAQVLEETKKLQARLMKIIRRYDLDSKLPKGRDPTISEIEDVLISSDIVQTKEKSMEFANKIMAITNKAANGEQIPQGVFEDFTLAFAWFELELDDLEDRAQ